MTPAAFRKLALSLPEAHEEPHFDRTSFRVAKKIFATMTDDGTEAMVPVHPLSRCFALLEAEPGKFFDYGGWTRRNGSTGIRLAKVDRDEIEPLLRAAWERVAPAKVRAQTSLFEAGEVSTLSTHPARTVEAAKSAATARAEKALALARAMRAVAKSAAVRAAQARAATVAMEIIAEEAAARAEHTIEASHALRGVAKGPKPAKTRKAAAKKRGSGTPRRRK